VVGLIIVDELFPFGVAGGGPLGDVVGLDTFGSPRGDRESADSPGMKNPTFGIAIGGTPAAFLGPIRSIGSPRKRFGADADGGSPLSAAAFLGAAEIGFGAAAVFAGLGSGFGVDAGPDVLFVATGGCFGAALGTGCCRGDKGAPTLVCADAVGVCVADFGNPPPILLV
jgi:hypothetical protein